MREMVAVLDNIRSAHNVGSMFRTADGAGVQKLYLCGVTPTPIDKWGRNNTKLSKVSLGAEEFVEWMHVSQTWRCIENLKRQGYTIVALEQDRRSRSLFEKRKLPDKVAIVVGPEVEGLSQSILKRADEIIEIPMHGKKESLNVAVAFGISIFSLMNLSR